MMYLHTGFRPAMISHTTAVTSTLTVTRKRPSTDTSMSVTRAPWHVSGGRIGWASFDTMRGFRSNWHTVRSHELENSVFEPVALPQHTADTADWWTSDALQCSLSE